MHCAAADDLKRLIQSRLMAAALQTLVSWLQPLLGAPPAYAKRKGSALSSNWQLLLLADNPTDELVLSPRETVTVAGLDEAWQVEVQLVSAKSPRLGVSDGIIQMCLSYVVGLELNRQGWMMVDGRFLRIPSGCAPSKCIPAAKLELTISQQRELTLYLNVTHVQFNALKCKAGRDLNEYKFGEQIVSSAAAAQRADLDRLLLAIS